MRGVIEDIGLKQSIRIPIENEDSQKTHSRRINRNSSCIGGRVWSLAMEKLSVSLVLNLLNFLEPFQPYPACSCRVSKCLLRSDMMSALKDPFFKRLITNGFDSEDS